ncbi:MAG: hypothetical protein H7329_11075 [Opitutaceae bacterium]|nr:hypothetical protein [Cytophagales bacterium]
MKSLTIILLSTLLLCSCKEDNSMGALLQALHGSMLEHDSILKVTHDRLNKKHEQWKIDYINARGGEMDSLHLKLEKAHDILLEKHDDIIDKHEVILRMHKRLIEKYNNGTLDQDFIKEEHKILEEEYKLMQIDHDQLIQDHAQLEKDHKDFIDEITLKNNK